MKNYLNYKLDILSAVAKRDADQIYQRECGLDVNHLRLLRLVSFYPEINPSELADRARLDRPKTSRMLARLVDRGFVVKRTTERDGRQVRLATSPQGQILIEKANHIATNLERAFLAPLTEKQQTELADWLDKLTHWVESGGLTRSYETDADELETRGQ